MEKHGVLERIPDDVVIGVDFGSEDEAWYCEAQRQKDGTVKILNCGRLIEGEVKWEDPD